jgi:hypothetical protein
MVLKRTNYHWNITNTFQVYLWSQTRIPVDTGSAVCFSSLSGERFREHSSGGSGLSRMTLGLFLNGSLLCLMYCSLSCGVSMTSSFVLYLVEETDCEHTVYGSYHRPSKSYHGWDDERMGRISPFSLQHLPQIYIL